MKRIILLLCAVFLLLIACNPTQDKKSFDENPRLESDTIRISNKKIEYEVIIIDDNSPDGTLGVAKKIQTVYGENKIVSRMKGAASA